LLQAIDSAGTQSPKAVAPASCLKGEGPSQWPQNHLQVINMKPAVNILIKKKTLLGHM